MSHLSKKKKDSKGRRVEWFVSMQINITRPDNEVIGGKWKFDVRANPWERYDIKDSRDDVISFFLTTHKPSGDEIMLADFSRIRQDYLRK